MSSADLKLASTSGGATQPKSSFGVGIGDADCIEPEQSRTLRLLALMLSAILVLCSFVHGSAGMRACQSARVPAMLYRRHTNEIYAAEIGGVDIGELLSSPPIIINRMEVLDETKGVLTPPSGVTLTPSGYLGLFIVALQQIFAPWGWVKYSKRLKEDEQAWLDAGKSPEQAVINAYQNVPVPPKAEAKPSDAVEEDGAESSK